MLIRRYQLALVSLMSVVLITTTFVSCSAPLINQNLKVVSSCTAEDQSNNLTLNGLSYWHHISRYPNEFSRLRFFNPETENEKYTLLPVSPSKFNKKTCINQDIILVKKVIHNKRQHANGIEMDLSDLQLTYGNLDSFKMRFQIDRPLSFTPQVSSLTSILQRQLPSQTRVDQILVDKLLNQNMTLKLVFYGHNHSDHKTMTVNGKKLVELLPNLPDGAWLELELTNTDLNTYWEKDWQGTAAPLADIIDQPILGFILMAETPSGKTLESLAKNMDSNGIDIKDVDELFIETYIRLGSISINKK
ncbi:hypothetical protein KO505_04525 [Psychrosphaera sp. F3M07]|uniref:hypothetical protein n=1 Tax=Psychrosphaera sp. F3M07 TaxID=2841560 RepID=UPI001C0990E5|nr:hypothetical protein [Psychrosphaera sp. F3M07]MBU2917230.1 hypothetical protein [Psychrosphaera sp. F3M07]